MEYYSVGRNGGDNDGASQPPRNKRPRTGLPPTTPSTTVTTSAADVSAAAVQENGCIGGLLLDEDSEDLEGLRGLPPTTPSTTATTSAANESAAAVQENGCIGGLFLDEDSEDTVQGNGFCGRLLLDDYSEDMEGLDQEPNQSEGEEEPTPEGSEEEGSYDGEREEEWEDRVYETDQEDEGSEEVYEINQGQAIDGEDIVSNDVSYGNTAGSLGTKSSMFGTFTDEDVLDCPICCEALTIPVFQCENGHLACSSCCIKIGNNCPSCSRPTGHIRCRAIERIINSVKFSCRNLEYGCKETLIYGKREEHEKACIFAPCSCPLESCDYLGSPKNLYDHFRGKHISSATQFDFKDYLTFWLTPKHGTVILQEMTDGTIFVLNHAGDSFPHAINVICIGAYNSKEEFSYKLSVDRGFNTLTLKSVTATMTKWSASQPLAKYLLVPFDFTYSGVISVEVCIEKRVIRWS